MSLASLLPFVPELFRDLHVLVPRREEKAEAAYAWFVGDRRTDAVWALIQTTLPHTLPPAAIPLGTPAGTRSTQSERAQKIVLIGRNRDRLFAEREEVKGACTESPPMGFLRSIAAPGWSNGLPHPVQVISASFCISSLDEREAEDFLKEAQRTLCAEGILFWSDFFLPQSLALFTRYCEEYARQLSALGVPAGAQEMTAGGIASLLQKKNLMVLENALSCLTKSGFSNIELVAKRMNVAVLAAYK
jgi:hypothetical protein